MNVSTRRSLSCAALVVALATASSAAAKQPPTPTASQTIRPVHDLLAALSGSGPGRAKAAADLAKHGPDAIEALDKFMSRKRQSSPEARRAVLRRVGASVPDKNGKFRNPRRKKKKQILQEDNFDWLAKLLELDAAGNVAVSDVVADIAALRALAAQHDIRGGDIIFRVAFTKNTMMYRDECGRYLRRMAPWSLPALVRRAAINKKYSSPRRYATYQLERMDLESPKKAVRAAAQNERLLADLLWAYGDSGYRPAVAQVLVHTNDDAPAVRRAARKGWMAYATRKAPDAPKRKLVLPGGKKTEKEKPLYLNFRELAVIEMRHLYEIVLGEPPPRRTKLVKMTETLFAHWDSERSAATDKQVVAALATAKTGELAKAAMRLDQVLALQDLPKRKAEVAAVYFNFAKTLEASGNWAKAAEAYSKAEALDPEGPNAPSARSGRYFAMAKSVQASGGDASALLARAGKRSKSSRSSGSSDIATESSAAKPVWMLYTGAGAGAIALLLLIVGLRRRTRATA